MVQFIKSRLTPDIAIQVCQNGTAGQICQNRGSKVSATLAVHSRRATTACAIANNSILSVSQLGAPVLNDDIDIEALGDALTWLLNFTAAGIPAQSSVVFSLWYNPPYVSYHYWSMEAYKTLKSLLAFPLWEFSENNFGNPYLDSTPRPPEFKTSASISEPFMRLVIDKNMWITYLVLESVMISIFWIIIAWRCCWRMYLPANSSHPLIDSAVKLVERKSGVLLSEAGGKARDLWNAGDREILSCFGDLEVIYRHEHGSRQTDILALSRIPETIDEETVHTGIRTEMRDQLTRRQSAPAQLY